MGIRTLQLSSNACHLPQSPINRTIFRETLPLRLALAVVLRSRSQSEIQNSGLASTKHPILFAGTGSGPRLPEFQPRSPKSSTVTYLPPSASALGHKNSFLGAVLVTGCVYFTVWYFELFLCSTSSVSIHFCYLCGETKPRLLVHQH